MDVEKEILELKKKVEDLQGQENSLLMIVFSGDLDKHLAAMIIATGAAAMGMKVSMFFTFWATAALRDPKKNAKGKNFMSKMFGFMLPKGRNKTVLSKMNMAGMGTAMMKDLMTKKHVANLDELFEAAGALGVEINICEMSMDLMGFKYEEMIDYPKMKVCGVATMLADARESAVQFFI